MYLYTSHHLSFTLYPAHSSVDRGNIMLRHSVSHFPPNYSRHSVLSGGTQCRGLPWCQSKEMKILRNNNQFPRVEIEPATVAFQSHPYAPEPRRPH